MRKIKNFVFNHHPKSVKNALNFLFGYCLQIAMQISKMSLSLKGVILILYININLFFIGILNVFVLEYRLSELYTLLLWVSSAIGGILLIFYLFIKIDS